MLRVVGPYWRDFVGGHATAERIFFAYLLHAFQLYKLSDYRGADSPIRTIPHVLVALKLRDRTYPITEVCSITEPRMDRGLRLGNSEVLLERAEPGIEIGLVSTTGYRGSLLSITGIEVVCCPTDSPVASRMMGHTTCCGKMGERRCYI